MKRHKGRMATAAAFAIACFVPVLAEIIYVDGQGTCSTSGTACTENAECPVGQTCVNVGLDTATCGPQGTPCFTIQWAYDQIADASVPPLDEIRVLSGTYRECPLLASPPPNPPKPIILRSQAWVDSTDRTSTIVTGLGECDGSQGAGSELPVISIGGNGAIVEGFTIEDGGLSGVEAFGGVTITNNIIRDNRSTGEAGGIFLYSATCDYGDVTAAISDNLIDNNRADGDGGGASVLATASNADAGAAPPCDLTGDASITIDNNTITNNVANGAEGGGLRLFTFSGDNRMAQIVVTQNTITDNEMDSPGTTSDGYGGGLWSSTFGYGTERFEITDNLFLNNFSTGDGAGLSAWIDAFVDGNHSVVIDRNTVDSNIAVGNGGGIDAFMSTIDLQPGQSAAMTVGNNDVFLNEAQGIVGIGGGGGILATQFSTRTPGDRVSFDVVNNSVTSNTAFELGGGVGMFVAADGDASGGVPAGPADARVFVANNLIAGNTAGTGSGTTGTGGGVSALLQSFGEATAVADVTLDTIAGNMAEGEAGGIHVESNTGFEDSPANEGLARLVIDSSIVADNDGDAVGGPEPGIPGIELPGGTGNLEIISRDNVYFGNAAGIFDPELLAAVTQTGDRTTVDPMLDPSYVSSLCERVGHPRPNQLPDVNGDGFVDGIDVLRIAVAFASNVGQPRYSAFADLDGDGMVDGVDLALAAAMRDFAMGCP